MVKYVSGGLLTIFNKHLSCYLQMSHKIRPVKPNLILSLRLSAVIYKSATKPWFCAGFYIWSNSVKKVTKPLAEIITHYKVWKLKLICFI